MQQDHKLDQVGAGLLPERLLAAAKEIGHQRGDAERQRIGVEIVVKRVVAVNGCETDFDVVLVTTVLLQDLANLLAEIPFDLQHESTESLRRLIGSVPEELLDVGMNAG